LQKCHSEDDEPMCQEWSDLR